MVRFGVQQIFTELFCLALLQEPSVERVKHVLRSDLGAVMGSGQAACVKTLRRKLGELSQERNAVHLGTLPARHWLEDGLANASYRDARDHGQVYNGAPLAPVVRNARQRSALAGIV